MTAILGLVERGEISRRTAIKELMPLVAEDNLRRLLNEHGHLL